MQDAGTAQSSEEPDINDVFSDIFLIENRIFEESFKEGHELGKKEENVEAFHLGYHRGAELGAEIGYYGAIAESYLTSFEKNQTGDEKVIKELRNLKELTDKFPRENDLEVDILGLISQVRAKFKKVCAILKIHPNFPESNQLSF